MPVAGTGSGWMKLAAAALTGACLTEWVAAITCKVSSGVIDDKCTSSGGIYRQSCVCRSEREFVLKCSSLLSP